MSNIFITRVENVHMIYVIEDAEDDKHYSNARESTNTWTDGRFQILVFGSPLSSWAQIPLSLGFPLGEPLTMSNVLYNAHNNNSSGKDELNYEGTLSKGHTKPLSG